MEVIAVFGGCNTDKVAFIAKVCDDDFGTNAIVLANKVTAI